MSPKKPPKRFSYFKSEETFPGRGGEPALHGSERSASRARLTPEGQRLRTIAERLQQIRTAKAIIQHELLEAEMHGHEEKALGIVKQLEALEKEEEKTHAKIREKK